MRNRDKKLDRGGALSSWLRDGGEDAGEVWNGWKGEKPTPQDSPGSPSPCEVLWEEKG